MKMHDRGFKDQQKAIKNFGTAAASTANPAAVGRQMARQATARAHRKARTKTSHAKRALNQK